MLIYRQKSIVPLHSSISKCFSQSFGTYLSLGELWADDESLVSNSTVRGALKPRSVCHASFDNRLDVRTGTDGVESTSADSSLPGTDAGADLDEESKSSGLAVGTLTGSISRRRRSTALLSLSQFDPKVRGDDTATGISGDIYGDAGSCCKGDKSLSLSLDGQAGSFGGDADPPIPLPSVSRSSAEIAVGNQEGRGDNSSEIDVAWMTQDLDKDEEILLNLEGFGQAASGRRKYETDGSRAATALAVINGRLDAVRATIASLRLSLDSQTRLSLESALEPAMHRPCFPTGPYLKVTK